MIRLAAALSIAASSFSALRTNSIFQSKLLFHISEAQSVFIEPSSGEMIVLQIIEIFENRLPGIPGLGATGLFGQRGQTLFDIFRKSDCKHWDKLLG